MRPIRFCITRQPIQDPQPQSYGSQYQQRANETHETHPEWQFRPSMNGFWSGCMNGDQYRLTLLQ